MATASTVLNAPRSNTRVSAATRERVIAAATRLRYHPNALARGLLGGQTRTLGVLFGLERASVAVANPYAFSVLQGIIAAAAEAGYNVTLFTEPWHNAERSAAPLRDRRTDGVLVIAAATDSDVVSSLAELGVPLVGVSTSCDRYGVPSVDVDNERGARLAVEHLLALGHTRIAYLMGDSNLLCTHQRGAGFDAALADAGIVADPTYILPGSFEAPSGYERMRRLLALAAPPTAVFAGNDTLAMAAIEAAHDAGVSVPSQFSVIGFDDIPMPSRLTPPLSTIRQPLAEIGATASRQLIALLKGEPVAPVTTLFAPELVGRGSTAPPAS